MERILDNNSGKIQEFKTSLKKGLNSNWSEELKPLRKGIRSWSERNIWQIGEICQKHFLEMILSNVSTQRGGGGVKAALDSFFFQEKSTCQAWFLFLGGGDGFTTMTSFLSEPICFVRSLKRRPPISQSTRVGLFESQGGLNHSFRVD